MPTERPLTLPDWVPPWWVGVALVGGWALLLPVAWFTIDDEQELMDILFPTINLAAVGLLVIALGLVQRWRLAHRRRQADRLGLAFRPHVYPSEIDPGFSLFALTSERRHWGGYVFEGRFHGERVKAFSYGFSGKYRTIDDESLLWTGQQTVFLADAAGAPDFHLGPADSDWPDLIDARRWLFGAGDNVLEVEIEGGRPAVLRGDDPRALRRLFNRRQREAMGLAPGWTIECRGGRLLLYRDRQVIAPRDLGRYLDQVTRIAAALRAAAMTMDDGPSPAVWRPKPAPPRRRDDIRPAGPGETP